MDSDIVGIVSRFAGRQRKDAEKYMLKLIDEGDMSAIGVYSYTNRDEYPDFYELWRKLAAGMLRDCVYRCKVKNGDAR